MWFKKLKKKKLQCLLIGVLLFISALIFTSSISLVTSIKSYVQKYYNNDEFYDLMIFDANASTKDDVLTWCKNNTKVKDAVSLDAFSSGNNMYHKGEKIKIPAYNLTTLEDYKNIPFGISKIKALNESSCPKNGEIWVTQLLADSHKISLGDTLDLKINGKVVSLKVSALINDSIQPSSLIGINMFYINKGNAEDFSSFRKVEFTYIKTKKNVNVSELGKSLNTAIDVGGLTGNNDILMQAATMVSSIMGGVAGLASLMVFAVSVFLIRFFLWNNIIKEYKSIGIYKALGFTKREILKFYIIGYSLTAVVGSILGALFSIPVLNFIGAKVLKYIGDFKSVDINFGTILITVLIFSFIVILNLYFVIRRTNKISPVEALRTGVTSSRKKLTKSFIKDNSSSLALAINDIFKYKKVTVYITLCLTLSIGLIIFFGNTNFTTLKMKDNSNAWFGCPKGNVYISLNGIDDKKKINTVLNDIENDKRVKNYAYGSSLAKNVQFDTEKYHIKTSLYGVMSIDSYKNQQELKTIEGHNPDKDNEVAVTINILKDSDLSVGDYIEISINNKKADYLISGSYNTLGNNGYQIRLLNSQIEKYDANYSFNEIYVNLKNEKDTESFEKDINKNYSYAGASTIEPNNKDMIETFPGLINPITFLLIGAFGVFSIIIVFNIIIMNLRDNRRNFGIMKALGFTSCQIRNRYLYRILILTGISSILAVIFNILFSKRIFMAAMGGIDVMLISGWVMAVSAAAMFIIVILTVLLCSRSIKNTKPTELIEE